ncbi:MAG: hypothetical protein J6583_10905 [Gilliamella sp.]|uniref:hypothetical protein n=1 Tax=Gilliamella sp. TaxID=1891236 RepID=UPI0025D0F2C4|nr:hypothetical protein [Gilliamella sp.]MCO6545508.1 hypothetical protein [Gilliamella sp.]MCO6548270.1 hypothetical protein [Gilliamella sp.]
MSTQIKKSDGKALKQYYGIAKICFYIMVFNIVVRIDLWISIAGVIVLMPYLLQKLLLKKIDAAKYLSMFNQYISAVKDVHKKPMQESISIPVQAEPTESTTVNFAEPSFEEIWRDCPQVDFVWDEDDCSKPTCQENFDECKKKVI